MTRNQIMTLEEVADYLRISERTVKDWVAQGKLPGGKLGTSWRFQRSDIENWVNQKLSPRIKDVTKKDKSLSGLLSKDRVLFLNAGSKNELLNQLIDVASELPGIHSREELAEAVHRREKLMSTGIGLGIGVPHVRLNDVKDLYISIAINKTGIPDYEALDDIPVQIVVLIVAGRNQHSQYIQVLSRIAKILKDKSVRDRLIQADNEDAVFDILKDEEI